MAKEKHEVQKDEPQVTIVVAQLYHFWFIPASFLNIPEGSFALASFC